MQKISVLVISPYPAAAHLRILRHRVMKSCPRCNEIFADDATYCALDGTALLEGADPLLGKTIAQRYRILSRLGAGGMANVYLARHVMIDRLSAMKVLHHEFANSAVHHDRFLREARSVNRINHENIVEITDFGEADDLVYLVMEYIPGDSLSKHLHTGPLAWRRVASLGAQIAAALARAHQVGVIHRDLKPGNVLLVTKNGRETAMLTDFGIAKLIDAPPLSNPMQLFGTLGYIAPEYLEFGVSNEKSDLYSLGVLLYESLTARLPYELDGTLASVIQVLHQPPRPLSEHPIEIAPSLAEMIMSLLANQPEERPQDAFWVFDQLAGLLKAEGFTSAGPLPLDAMPSSPSSPAYEHTANPGAASGLSQWAAKPSATRPLSNGSNGSLASGSAVTLDEPWPFSELVPHCWQALETLESAAAACEPLLPRARWALGQARALVQDATFAVGAVNEEQNRIAQFETYGRDFRTTIGHALDELGHDLSRIQTQREEVTRERSAADIRRSFSAMPSADEDTALWEHAVLSEQEGRVQQVEGDLLYQMHTLREQLRLKNEDLDRQLEEARGVLEGRVAALRRLVAEARGAIDEVARSTPLQRQSVLQ